MNHHPQGPVTVTIEEPNGYFESHGRADRVKAD